MGIAVEDQIGTALVGGYLGQKNQPDMTLSIAVAIVVNLRGYLAQPALCNPGNAKFAPQIAHLMLGKRQRDIDWLAAPIDAGFFDE